MKPGWARFHAWSDSRLSRVINHAAPSERDPWDIWRLRILREQALDLGSNVFLYVKPGIRITMPILESLKRLRQTPIYAPLSALDRSGWTRDERETFAALCSAFGVPNRRVLWCRAEFWAIKAAAVPSAFDLCGEFWHRSKDAGVEMRWERCLAYAMQMMCGDPWRYALE